MLKLLVFIFIFVTIFLIFDILLSTLFRSRYMVKIRLDSIVKDTLKEKENELNQSLFTRLIKPFLEDISKIVLKVTPKEMITSLEKKVLMAGNPFGMSVKEWVNVQVIIMISLPLVTAVFSYYIGLEVKTVFLIILIEIGFGLLLPNAILGKSVGERQRKILNSLPDVLDLLTVSVEAGLSFDGALTKVIDKMPGPLAEEFSNVLQETKVGKQKRDALRGMADRVNVHDLTTLIGSIIQADQLGVSIGNVLRLQSEQIRQKRRQRAQEKAMKAPVKMLIPMVLFIFPTIFSVLIGPVIVRVVYTFIK